MKTRNQTKSSKKFFFFFILLTAFILLSSTNDAQYWNLTGNADASSSTFLGTNNRQSLIIKTDNITRATFNAGGNLTMSTGIIFSGQTRGITFSPVSSGSVTPMIYMFSSGTTNSNRMVLAHSSAYPAWGLEYQDVGDKFNFLNNGTNVMTVDLGNKRVGIGTNTPSYPLHVTGDNTTAYVTSSFLSPNGSAMYVYYDGTPFNYGSRAFFAKAKSGNNTATAGYFESDFIGVDAHTTAGQSGGYGLSGVVTGNGSTASYGVYGKANNDFFNYGVYGTASGGNTNYAVYASGNLGYTGSLIHVSDEKLKHNVEPLPQALQKIMILKPKVYDFRTTEFAIMNLSAGKHFGLIAQEVQKVLPELVLKQAFPPQYDEQHKKIHDAIEYLGLNYTELIPVIIAAMQEQQEEIQKKDSDVQNLQKQIDELRNQLTLIKSSQSSSSTVDNNKISAYLNAVIPNPVKANATINYYIPAQVKNAAITLHDANGKQVKFINAAGRGTGSISLSTQNLAAGMYICNLLINGVIADTKNIEVLK